MSETDHSTGGGRSRILPRTPSPRRFPDRHFRRLDL